MSEGPRLPFREAFELARHLSEDLRGAVRRSKVAGSLRRRRDTVGDIEIVIEPHMVSTDLFDGPLEPDVEQVLFVAMQWGTLLEHGQRMIRVGDVLGKEGLKCEIHVVHPPAEWGSKLAICTGPADLGRLAVTAMRYRGYQHVDGRVIERKSRRHMPTPEEADFFRLAGLPLVVPARRDELVEHLTSGQPLKEFR